MTTLSLRPHTENADVGIRSTYVRLHERPAGKTSRDTDRTKFTAALLLMTHVARACRQV